MTSRAKFTFVNYPLALIVTPRTTKVLISQTGHLVFWRPHFYGNGVRHLHGHSPILHHER